MVYPKADGKRIRELRVINDMKQSELVKLTKLGEKTIYNAENSHRLNPATLKKVADALGVSVSDITLHEASSHEEYWDFHSCWIYALVGERQHRPQHVVGSFCTQFSRKRPFVIRAEGRAYWVRPKKGIELRGEWYTDESLNDNKQILFYYHMRNKEIGDNAEKPDIHDGIIRLEKRNRKPIYGKELFDGFVHDLFDWRDNNLDMVAEKMSSDWQSTMDFVRDKGREIFEQLRKNADI